MRSSLLYMCVALMSCFVSLAWAASPSPEAAPAIDPRATAALKEMSNTLSQAKSLSFNASTMTPVHTPSGQWVHVFEMANVELKRPGDLLIQTGGDAFAQTIFFDGKTFSVIAQDSKLYSQTPMPGNIDQMLEQASTKGSYSFPFSDVLTSDPFSSWSKDLEKARYIGESTRGQEKLQHFSFAAKSVDWEVWIDEQTHLPRMVFVKYVGVERSPTVLIEFSKWKINPVFPVSAFTFHTPAGGKKVELKAPAGETR